MVVNMMSLSKKKQGSVNQKLASLRRGLVKFWPLFIPLLIYIPGMVGKIPFPSSEALFTDMLISHYPNAIYIKQSLQEYHVIPLWSPLVLGGYPFFANPLSGLWYPFGWLAVMFPLPAGFSIVAALHALWGGFGFYKLLQREEVAHRPALMGALAFQALPKISAHYGAGHITLVYAVYWTPWLLIAARGEKRISRSALAMAAIFLADPRWSVFSGLLWLPYMIAHSHNYKRSTALGTFKVVAYAFLIAAPLAVPMLEYVPRTTRWGMAVDEILTHSLKPSEIIGGLFPSGGRSPETAFYTGGVILMLALFGMVQPSIRKRTRFWWGAALVSGIYALGSNIPGMALVARLPGFSLIRVPPRALFIYSLSVTVIAAHAVNKLVNTRPKKAYLLASTAGALFFILLLAGVGYSVNSYQIELVWGMAAMALGMALILGYANIKSSSRSWFLAVLTIMVLVDTVGAANFNIDYRPPDFIEPGQRVTWLGDKKGNYGQFRTYSPSYSLPQEHGGRYQFEMVDGVDPLQLESYVQLMESATGIPQRGYHVTIPPYNGLPRESNRGADPAPELLGLLNVEYVVADFQISKDGLVPVFVTDQGFIYRNEKNLPRAWVQPWTGDEKAEYLDKHRDKISGVKDMFWEPNHITLNATGPGTLVLSEIAYPGWQVLVDGDRSTLRTDYNILRGVPLGAGHHHVEFRFRPKSLMVGIILSAAGIILTYREHQSER